MKTIIAAIALLALSSQANANDAVKQGIIGVWQCVQVALDAGPGKPRVHSDAILVAIRACKEASFRLGAAFDAAGVSHEDRQSIVEGTVNVMFDAWAIK